jgi:tetratricopeptide (TPR) repeat protein
MKLPAYAVRIFLVAMFVIAAAIRLGAVDRNTSPYFKGPSAMNYRHVAAAADGADLDQRADRANWPEGYVPDRYRPAGVEWALARLVQAARYVSEADPRDLVRTVVALTAAALVFLVYGVARGLWGCQAGALLAAFLVAFLPPFVRATTGREFGHALFGIALVCVHALLWLAWRRRNRLVPALLAAFAILPVLTVWELGAYYAAAACAVTAFVPGISRRERLAITIAHAAVLVIGAFWVPYLVAVRAAASWPVMCALASVAVQLAPPGRFTQWWAKPAGIAGITVVLTLVTAPLRGGAGWDLPAVAYVLTRLRHLGGKPEVPLALSDEMRHLWSSDHAPMSAHSLLMIAPLVLVGVAVALAVPRLPARRAAVIALPVAFLALVAAAVDRAAIVAATPLVAVAAAAAGHRLSQALRTRGVMLAMAGLLILVQALAPLNPVNPTFALARAAGIAHRDPARFLWVSLENTDRELVRFVSQRTSVRNSVLGSPDISALLLAFTGRKSVQLEGALATAAGERRVALARTAYADEATLHAECRRLGVDYVLYSIDYVMDTSRYSPRYLAGLADLTGESVAWRMHFHPEQLTRFTLVYENAHYRLFRVADRPEPVFLTDHPPVYQVDILERLGGDIDAFRTQIIGLMLSWRQAVLAREAGNNERALSILGYMLEQAPRFTDARLALSEVLVQLDRIDEARTTVLSVIAYAPDNPLALYQAAYIFGRQGDEARARSYLELFRTTPADPDLTRRADLLEQFLDQGLPIEPGSPVDSVLTDIEAAGESEQ